jgi:hypothetical protein
VPPKTHESHHRIPHLRALLRGDPHRKSPSQNHHVRRRYRRSLQRGFFSWYEYKPTYEPWSIYSLFPRILRFGPLFGVHEPEAIALGSRKSAWAVPSEIDRRLGVQTLTVDFLLEEKASCLSSSSSEAPELEL